MLPVTGLTASAGTGSSRSRPGDTSDYFSWTRPTRRRGPPPARTGRLDGAVVRAAVPGMGPDPGPAAGGHLGGLRRPVDRLRTRRGSSRGSASTPQGSRRPATPRRPAACPTPRPADGGGVGGVDDRAVPAVRRRPLRGWAPPAVALDWTHRRSAYGTRRPPRGLTVAWTVPAGDAARPPSTSSRSRSPGRGGRRSSTSASPSTAAFTHVVPIGSAPDRPPGTASSARIQCKVPVHRRRVSARDRRTSTRGGHTRRDGDRLPRPGGAVGPCTGVAFYTTAANTIAVAAKWGATATGQSVTGIT